MANDKNNKRLPKKHIEVKETSIPSGQTNYEALIKGEVTLVGETLSNALASFYVGNAAKGKDMNSFINNVKQNKKSILGNQNSLYKLLEDLKNLFYSKQFIKSYTKNSNNISAKLNSIDTVFDSLSQSYSENNEKYNQLFEKYQRLLISAINQEKNVLSENLLSGSHFDNKIGEFTKNLNTETRKLLNKQILPQNTQQVFDALLQYFKNEEESLKYLEDIENNTDKSINNIKQDNSDKINEDIVKCLNGLLELEEKIEKLTDVKSYYESTTENLFNQIKELKEKEKQELLEAKLNLAIEGLDANSIQSLIEFSKINFDQANENVQNYISFLTSIEGLQSLHLENVNEQLKQLPDILEPLMSNGKSINYIVNMLSEEDVNNLSLIILNFSKVFENIKQFPKTTNTQEVLKSFGALNGILGAMIYSIPLILIVNGLFGQHEWKSKTYTLVSFEKLTSVFTSFSNLFTTINKIQPFTQGPQLLKSIGLLNAILGAMMYSIPLILAVNGLFGQHDFKVKGKSHKYTLVSLTKLVSVFENIDLLFGTIKDVRGIDNGKDLLKSFVVFNALLGAMLYSIPLIVSINKLYKVVNVENTSEIFNKFGNTLFNKINNLNSIDSSKSSNVIQSFKDLNKINMDLLKSLILIKLVNKKKDGYIELIDAYSKLFDKDGKNGSLQKLFNKINSLNEINKSENKIKSLEDFIKIAKLLKKLSKKDLTLNENGENIKQLCDTSKDIFEKFNQLFPKIKINNLDTIQNGFITIENILNKIDDIKYKEKYNEKLYNIQNLLREDFFNNLNNISERIYVENIIKIQRALISLDNILKSIDSLKVNKKAPDNINKINELLFGVDENGKNCLTEIFTSIKENVEIPQDNNIQDIVQACGALSNIVESVNNIKKSIQDPEELKEYLDKYLKILEESYKNIKEKFELIIATGNLADRVKASNESIQNAMESNNETIVKTSSKQEDIKKANISMEGMTSFMISAAIVMSIGALLVMMGGGKFIKAAIQFGLSLALFEGLVLLPALMFFNQKTTALSGIESFNSFVVTCALTMLVGAIIYAFSGGKLVKNAIAFGITLGVFEALVIAPIILFNKESGNVLKSIDDFKNFVITTTVIMLIGALAVHLMGGKMIMNSLKFAGALFVFETLVVLPFVLFGRLKSEIFEHAKEFTGLLITCTVVMLVGALFFMLGGGKYIKAAYKFATALMTFEALVIAPFLIFNFLKKEVFSGLKSFSTVIMTCTIVLLVGALFMSLKGGKYVKSAMLFTGLLMAFEVAVIMPFLIFNFIKSPVMGGLKGFAVVILATSIVMMVGAIFMTAKGGIYPKHVMLFAGLLALFEAAVTAPMLLFNLIKENALSNAKDFAIFVTACAFSLVIGAFFIANYGSKPVLEFGIVLSGFVLIASGAAALMGNFSGKNLDKAREFGIYILICSASLLIGALFIMKYSASPVLKFAGCLLLFVGLMGAVMVALEFGFKAAGGEPTVMAQMAALGSFILLSTVSLAIGAYVMDKYGWSVLGYAVLLVGFIGLMGLVFIGLTYIGLLIAPGAAVAALMGVSLLLLTGSIMLINAMFINDPKGKKTKENIEVLGDVLGSLKWTYALLGLLSPLILLGSVAAVAIGASMMILSASFALINLIIGKHGEELQTNIGILNGILGGSLMWTYTLLGLLSPIIVLGSIAATAIGVSIAILGSSFALVNLLLGGENGANLQTNIELLNTLLGISYLGGTYAILGLLAVPIALGSAVGVAMALSITLLGGALALVNLFMDPIKDSILDNIDLMQECVIQVGLLAGELLLMTIPLALGLPGLGLMNLFCLGITTSTLMISASVKSMAEIGDLENSIDLVIGNLQKFVDIPDKVSFGGIFGMMKKLAAIASIRSMVMPMGKAMKLLAESVQDIASLKVPTKWDKEGNAVGYRQLNDGDFDLATNNIGKLLTTMAFAFTDAWYGTGNSEHSLKELATSDDNALWQTLYFSKQVGQVIKGIAEGVGAMAKMQIPISWDEKGNPIGFRQLKQKDFDLAAQGTETIITNVANTIMDIYAKGWAWGIMFGDGEHNIFDTVGGGLFSSDKPSPFINVLEASLKIGEVIANIGGAVGSIAKMQIPIAWDEKGKATRFRTLKQSDFKMMADSVSIVLTSIFTCLGDLYAKGTSKEFGSDGEQNIFDMVSNFIGSDDPPPIMRVIEASFKISELIANIGKGIKDMATMQIADRWNEDGKPIHYIKLTRSDFRQAAQSVGDIITCLISALKEQSMSGAFKVGSIIEDMLPMSELISGMADGIVKLASGQVADQWDEKTGKPIHFTKITPQDYLMAGITVGNIVSYMTETLMDVAYGKGNGYKSDAPLAKIFEGDEFKNIVEAISSTGSLISNIADSVIKIGQALIPDQWDKEGKPIHYTKVDLVKAKEDLKATLKSILFATTSTIISLYNGDGTPGSGLKELISDSEDSPFLIATQGIGTIMKTVSELTDAVVKIGSAMIPDKWDKNGKAIHFHKIDVNAAIDNIKTMFSSSSDGLFSTLCSTIYDLNNVYFADNGSMRITDSLPTVADGINSICKLIGNAADLVVKISTLNIPTKFDKDGKGTNYVKLDNTHIDSAKDNMVKIITSLFGIFENPEIQKYFNKETIDKIVEDQSVINDGIIAVGSLISTMMTQVKTITKYDEQVSKLFKMKSYSKQTENNKDISIGVIRDIFTIVKDFGILSQAVTTSGINFADEQTLDNMNNNIYSISQFVSSTILSIAGLITDIENTGLQNISKYIMDESSSSYIPNLINGIYNVYKSFLKSIYLQSGEEPSFYMLITSIPNNSMQLISKEMSENMSEINMFISEMITDYYNLTSRFDNIQNATIDENKLKDIIAFYIAAIGEIKKLNASLNSDSNSVLAITPWSKSDTMNLTKLSKDIASIAIVIGTMFQGIGDSFNIYYENVQNFKNNITDIISQMELSDSGLAKSMQTLDDNLTALKAIYTQKFADVNFDDETLFTNLTNDLSNFIYNGINPFDESLFTKFNNLNSSINTIYQTISKQRGGVKEFKQNTNELGNYIRVINSVQLNKLKPLTTLVQELNKLANKLGGLDKLTEHLSGELAVVLKELVDALNESKGTIEDAHKLQKERHDQINKSINTIKGLMNMPLNVNVQASGMQQEMPEADPADPITDKRTQVTSRGNDGQGNSERQDGNRGGQSNQNANRNSSRTTR